MKLSLNSVIITLFTVLTVASVHGMTDSSSRDKELKGEREQYVPQVIIDTKWGSNPSEFGLYKYGARPEQIDGPRYFYVTKKGDIYFLESVPKHST